MDPWNPDKATREIVRRVAETMSAFHKSAAPTAFMWVEWCTLLALISYAEQQTDLWPLLAIRWVLALLMWGYFVDFFSEEFRWREKKELFSAGALLSAIVALASTFGMMFASYWLAGVFVKQPL